MIKASYDSELTGVRGLRGSSGWRSARNLWCHAELQHKPKGVPACLRNEVKLALSARAQSAVGDRGGGGGGPRSSTHSRSSCFGLMILRKYVGSSDMACWRDRLLPTPLTVVGSMLH